MFDATAYLATLTREPPTAPGIALALHIDHRLLGIETPPFDVDSVFAVRLWWPETFGTYTQARAEGFRQMAHSPRGADLITFESWAPGEGPRARRVEVAHG